MSTSKSMNRICVIAVVLALLITVLFANGQSLGLAVQSKTMGYEDRLFDTARVHSLSIVMDDWDSFLSTAQSEEYALCNVVIDGESYKNVAIRAKGNTSLSTVATMDSDRYSFKIEFDHYDSTKTYHGLDKISLNNLIQDNTMMKDYLTYQMMARFGVAAPLCSFVYITVNGEDWGLYLAVEAVEESFLERNYGSDYGQLYKPDSLSMGGGRGNGKDFDMERFDFDDFQPDEAAAPDPSAQKADFGAKPGGNGGFSLNIDETALRQALEEQGIDPSILDDVDLENITMDTAMELISRLDGVDLMSLMNTVMESGAVELPNMGGGDFGGGMGSSDVKLQYIDDDPDSYSAIFGSAKTDCTDADQQRLIQSLQALSGDDPASAVDTESVLRYFVVHNYVVNADSYTGSMVHNYYLYEKDGKLSMIPWDYNLAFGTFQGGSASTMVNDDIDAPLSVTGSGRPMIDWIFGSEDYTGQYHQLFQEFLNTVDPAAIIDEAYALITEYVEQDPTKFCTTEEFETGVQTLRAFCDLRSQSVAQQLTGECGTVDATSITLSDMGTMNQGMGGGEMPDFEPGGFDRDGQSPQSADFDPGTMTLPEGDQAPADMELPAFGENDRQMPPDTEETDRQVPDIPSGKTPPEDLTGSETRPDAAPQPDGQPNAAAQTSPPDMPQNDAMQNMDFPGSTGTSLPILLAVSVLLLAAGLIFAFRYKR